MKRIVITGATSMIGIALIDRAIQLKTIQQIYAVVRPNSSKIFRIPSDSRITVVPCDVADFASLPEMILKKCDTFYHLAWPRTSTYQESFDDIAEKCSNIRITLDAVKAASQMGCSKFIGAGSQSEYGLLSDEIIKPDSICNPVRADGVLHLAAGQLARIVSKSMGMDCIWMRIFSIYGKYDRSNSMISTTITKLLKGEHCAFTASEQRWNFLNAEDAGNAFLLAGERSTGNHIYCLGDKISRPLREYIEILRDVVAPETVVGIGELPYPKQPIMNMNIDISELENDTGWKPEVNFENGIRKLVDNIRINI